MVALCGIDSALAGAITRHGNTRRLIEPGFSEAMRDILAKKRNKGAKV